MRFESASSAIRPATSRLVWLLGGSLGLVSLAAAGTIAIRNALPEHGPEAELPTGPAVSHAAPASPKRATPPARLATGKTKCADCGVVESVRSVTRKGQAAGLSTDGSGSARQAIDKRARSHMVHELRVRMDDGSLRLIEQVQPEADAGDRVVVEGNSLRSAPADQG